MVPLKAMDLKNFAKIKRLIIQFDAPFLSISE